MLIKLVRPLLTVGFILMVGLLPGQAQFNQNYDIPTNDNPGGGHSQWFKLNIVLNQNGQGTIHVKVENDVLRGWSGSFQFDFKELTSPTSDQLLFRVVSPTYSICAKPPGPAISETVDLPVMMDPAIAQRFIAHPSMYGIKLTHDDGDWFFCGSGEKLRQAGQALTQAFAGGGL